MLNLQRVATFVAVVEAGSFTAAAEALQQTKAAISFNVRRLEEELGVALLLRTTRRLALTQSGDAFYARAVRLLADSAALMHDVQQNHLSLTGELTVTSTAEYGARKVIPALAAFAQQHPQLQVRHVSSSAHADLISERFDVAIRLGKLADSSYRAAPVERFAILPVASPAWLVAHPVTTLAGLAEADWILHQRLASPRRWSLQGPAGPVALEISGPARFSSDSASALLAFAAASCGVALLPEWLVRQPLAEGRLQTVLPQYRFPDQGVYALWPDSRHLPARVRAFIDFLRAWVAGGDSDPAGEPGAGR